MTDKSKIFLLSSAVRAAPPNDDWKIIWGCQEFDGNPGFYVEKSVANFSMKNLRTMFFATAPKGSHRYRFDVYELTNDAGQVIKAASCEVSNGVWASAIWDPLPTGVV
ncbi:hypothetical protein [uncultured Tateyamaria sp.]|uniref:hypothetical protein n=1 Tax=uncultured Tateyamaria sp. TaxID=455651 RepID=UPI002622E00B|nr:hypothetical protein [uncultured Tateyamaria sp.]